MANLPLIGISSTIAIVIGGFAVSAAAGQQKYFNSQSCATTLKSVLNDAREQAHASKLGGVTVVLSSVAIGQNPKALVANVYDGRPDAGGPVMNETPIAGPVTFPPSITVGAPGVSSTVPIAIFIASDFTTDVAEWNIGDGTLAAEPSCPASGTQAIVFSDGSVQTTATVNCQTGQIQ